MATTKVIYNGSRLIPAPLISIVKQVERTEDQTKIGVTYRLTVIGTIVAFMGSPMTNGTFWNQPEYPPDEDIPAASRLKAILRKQEAIMELFSEDGHQFEVQSGDGTQPMKCNPRLVDINIPEGQWFDRCEYTITLECDVLSINGQVLGEEEFDEFISQASESWNFETDETPEGINLPRTYRLTHTVSATGKRFYDETGELVSPAWHQARNYVTARLGYSSEVASNSGVNNLPSYYGGYNMARLSQQDELAGNYSVTESWILTSGNALEEFNVEAKTDSSTGVTSVSVQGTITGLEERDNNMSLLVTKYTNAESKWGNVESSLLTRAQHYTGLLLNPFTLSKLVARNDINGVISYSYEYDTRPTNLFAGANYEGITLNEVLPSDLFSSIPVIGRANGPVLQGLGSINERAVSLNIELILQPNSFGGGTEGEIRSALYSNPRITQSTVFNRIVQASRPSIQYNTLYEYTRNQNESWDVKNGRYSYSVEFIFGN